MSATERVEAVLSWPFMTGRRYVAVLVVALVVRCLIG